MILRGYILRKRTKSPYKTGSIGWSRMSLNGYGWFYSSSYFDQINVFWFWLLAVIATMPMWGAPKPDRDDSIRATENIGAPPPA